MPHSERRSVSAEESSPVGEPPVVDRSSAEDGAPLSATQEGDGGDTGRTLVDIDPFDLNDSDYSQDRDSTSEDSAYTYERVDGEVGDEGDELADGGGLRLEATWSRALLGYPLVQLEGGWVVAPAGELPGFPLSVEVADVLSRHLKWQRARYAQRLLVAGYRRAELAGMPGAPEDQGQPIDEEGCRSAVGELTAQIEEVERLKGYVEQAWHMHTQRNWHELIERQAARRARRREQRRQYLAEGRRT
ncbi:hypothetical protein BGX34_007486, partial [Mortierella sp. NVP85]